MGYMHHTRYKGHCCVSQQMPPHDYDFYESLNINFLFWGLTTCLGEVYFYILILSGLTENDNLKRAYLFVLFL